MFRPASLLNRSATFAYVNFVLRNRHLARWIPFKQPPVLLLSYPRCGSSWVGKILSTSPDFAYLREPITQGFRKRFSGGPMVDPQSHPGGRYYERLITDTFLGIWAYKASVRPGPLEDFSLRSRGGKQLLIKEVNPFLAQLLSGAGGPRILFLVRHPASVADSYLRMGWLKQSWSEFGRQYGNDLAKSIDSCESSLVLHYEEFALDPEAKFADLFEQLSVRSPTDFDSVIQKYCYAGGAGKGPYETTRVSHDQVCKWRQSLDRTQIEALREGYFTSDLPFYRADADWM